MPVDLREQVLMRIDMDRELHDLLGNHDWSVGNEYRFKCPHTESHKNGDKNFSLLANASSGFWSCQSCGVRGDIFGLYADVRGMNRQTDFGIILRHLAGKYGVGLTTTKFDSSGDERARGIKILLQDNKQLFTWSSHVNTKKQFTPEAVACLAANYGINLTTAIERGYVYTAGRLWIPIYKDYPDPKNLRKSSIVNFRKHDILREHCVFVDTDGNEYTKKPAGVETKPHWKCGKCISVSGYGSCYVHPMSVLLRNGEVWVVGGELKADLLNQNGIPAVSFTVGEGKFNKNLLQHFSGKTVRVLMDIDGAGEHARTVLAQTFADNGALASWAGRLPKEGLPDNGDITDYLRLHDWNIGCIKDITWERFLPARMVSKESVYKEPPAETFPEFSDLPQVKFDELFNPQNADQWIRVPYVVAGRAEAPYLVPQLVTAVCEEGGIAGEVCDMCRNCPLPGWQYEHSILLDSQTRVSFAGQSPAKVRLYLHSKMGLPRCHRPTIDFRNDSVEPLVIIPTLDASQSGDQFNYRQHGIWTVGAEHQAENQSYEAVGKVIPQPKDGKFTFVVARHRALDNDIFSYRFDLEKHRQLHDAMWAGGRKYMSDVFNALVEDMRDHVLHKYNVEQMIAMQLLAFHLPFEFSIGPFKNYKVCPEVAIIGETRTGKSSMAKELLGYYGAGRYVDAPTATSVGLIGGNTSFGKTNIFTWGVLPMAHRAIVVIDEANKLSLDDLARITNLRSSGVAERTTASGVRKIRSNVRFLWLANPRGNKELRFYGDPVRAAQEVFGTPQDLARVDLLHIQNSQKNPDLVNKFYEASHPHWYTQSIARYHLSWVWSIKPDDISFDDPFYLMDKIQEIAPPKQHPMFQPTEAKFKLAKVAIALTCLTHKVEEDGLIRVSNEAVEYSAQLLRKMLSGAEDTTVKFDGPVPPPLLALLNVLADGLKPRLRHFIHQNSISVADGRGMFTQDWFLRFVQVACYELELAEYKGRYVMWDERLAGIVASYFEARKVVDVPDNRNYDNAGYDNQNYDRDYNDRD